MAEQKRGNLTIFIFPYLFIDKEVGLCGYKLKPSYTTIFNKEPTRVRGHLTKIAKSFRLQDTISINQYTYGWATIRNKEEWLKLKIFLDTFSTLLRYQELSDEKSGANFSNFDYAVFEIYRPMSTSKLDYYEGVLNGRRSIAINYPRTKFCPNFDIRPYLTQTEGESQIFKHLFHFADSYHPKEEQKRYLRALEWFNKSFKADPEIDDLEKYTCLAAAFEALFSSPPETIQATLAASITALLGETQEMLHWVKDFYGQRSKIVHGKEEPTTLYRGKSSNQFHLSHILFARKVFTRCVKAIFISREQVYTKDLHSELISNERRLKEILAAFNSNSTVKKLYDTGALSTFESLTQRDAGGKVEDVVALGKRLLPLTRSLLVKQKNSGLVKKLDEIVAYTGNDFADLAVKYSDFHQGFSPVYFGDKTISVKGFEKLVLKGAVYNFSSYASWRLFYEAFNKRR